MKFLAQRFVAGHDEFYAWLDSGSEELADRTFQRKPVDVIAPFGAGYALGRGLVDLIEEGSVRVHGDIWRPAKRWETTFLRMWMRALERMGCRTLLTPAPEEKG